MENEIVLTDIFEKLKEEANLLKAEIARLLQEKHDLECNICPALKVEYMEKVGNLINRISAQRLMLEELKYRIQLVQAALNQARRIKQEELDKKVLAEYREYNQKVEEQFRQAEEDKKKEEQRRKKEAWQEEQYNRRHESSRQNGGFAESNEEADGEYGSGGKDRTCRKGKTSEKEGNGSDSNPEKDGNDETSQDGKDRDASAGEGGKTSEENTSSRERNADSSQSETTEGGDDSEEDNSNNENSNEENSNANRDGDSSSDNSKNASADDDLARMPYKKKLKELYRRIVKKLHPDMNPNQTERQKELWFQTQDAFREGDVEKLEQIYNEINQIPVEDIEETEDGRAALEKLIESLRRQRSSLLVEIDTIKSEFPYSEKEFLENEEEVKQKQDLLNDLIRQYEDAINTANERLQQLFKEAEEL